MDKTIGLILAGGVGSRLSVLATSRAKPAVPFGGIYRIIDFSLSNAINSGINHLGVLTQYKPLSLMEHIGNGEPWGFIGRTRGAKILPPRTGDKASDWYRGTADAVRQNLDFINDHENCDTVLILSGDHIYHMDYSAMIRQHRQTGADLTIAMMEVPLEDARHFGIAEVDDTLRLVSWEEKPAIPRSNLASMGIYAFSLKFLEEAFYQCSGVDFGKHIIPFAYQNAKTYAWKFKGYWRDVGTIKAYWQANLDLLTPASGLSPEEWHIYTNLDEAFRIGDRPPTYIGRQAQVENSLISQGCTIEGTVINSVLSPGVWVQKNAVIRDSVVMNNCEVSANAVVDRAIIDKNVVIHEGVRLGHGEISGPNQDFPHILEAGLTLVGKNASIPEKCTVGRHCIIWPETTAEEFMKKEVPAGTTVLSDKYESFQEHEAVQKEQA